jgi:hypothetical protein
MRNLLCGRGPADRAMHTTATTARRWNREDLLSPPAWSSILSMPIGRRNPVMSWKRRQQL